MGGGGGGQRYRSVLGYLMLQTLRHDFKSTLVLGLEFGTPKFYIAPYGKINHGFVKVS